MAGRKKKRVDEEMQSLESNSDGDHNENGAMDVQQENDVDDEVQVDFEARTAEENDFHGIQKLIKQLFLKAHINAGELTDTIISQNYVGSVLKQIQDDDMMEDEDDDPDDADTVYGIVTVVNITHRKTLNCVKELKTHILGKCPSAEQRGKLESLLNDDSQHVGLLINERFINIPPQIAVPTLNCLWEELTEANAKKMKYTFSHYLMLSKTYFMAAPVKKSKKKNSQQQQQGQRMFSNPEEELFLQESVLSFDFSVKQDRDTGIGGEWQGEDDDELEPFRSVMVIPAASIPVIMGRMAEMYAIPLQ